MWSYERIYLQKSEWIMNMKPTKESADDGPPSSPTKNLKPLFTDEVECFSILPVMTIQTWQPR